MKIEDLNEYIQAEGFRPKIGNDNDLKFKYEGGTFWVELDQKDESFIRVIYPNFWEIESEEELIKCYKVSSKLCMEYKVVKMFVIEYEDSKSVIASMEFLLPDFESFKSIFLRVIRALAAATNEFSTLMTQKEQDGQ